MTLTQQQTTDNEEIVCVDLSAAFDTVSDETLLDRRLYRLSSVACWNIALTWMRSHLGD